MTHEEDSSSILLFNQEPPQRYGRPDYFEYVRCQADDDGHHCGYRGSLYSNTMGVIRQSLIICGTSVVFWHQESTGREIRISGGKYWEQFTPAKGTRALRMWPDVRLSGHRWSPCFILSGRAVRPHAAQSVPAAVLVSGLGFWAEV